KKEDPVVRIWANVGYMRAKSIEEKRLTFIGKLLDNDILGVRSQAARALGMIGPEAKSQLPRLKMALKDENGIMLNWVFFALGNMGPSARGAISSLKALKEKAAKKQNKGLEKTVEALIKAIKEAKPPKEKKVEKQKPPKKKPKNGKKGPRGDRIED